MTNTLAHVLTQLGIWTARPSAFLFVTAYAASWFAFSAETLDWHGIATLATWFMTLFIQRVGHRDTQALQPKVDELLKVTTGAENRLMKLDEKEPEEVERIRVQRSE